MYLVYSSCHSLWTNIC